MNELTEMTELAARLLRAHPDAPAVEEISVHVSQRARLVSFELAPEPKLRNSVLGIAAWAVALKTVVTVTDLRFMGACEIAADAVIDGRTVRVCNSLTPEHLGHLRALTGADFVDDKASFDPVALQTAFSATAVA